MNQEEQWLLPDGVEEVLPERARAIEELRRRALDLYRSWGYELVFPPLIEFLESLLNGAGRDLERDTFKITDQLSGRLMGVRADMTPQVARIDAHGLRRNAPTRLCYCSTALRAKPPQAGGTRLPYQLGVELFGHDGADSDLEVILLLLETLALAGAGDRVVLDLGHVGIFRALVAACDLSEADQAALEDIYLRKARTELEGFVAGRALPDAARRALAALPFRYFETLGGVYDARERRFIRLPLVGFEADTAWRAWSLNLFNRANLAMALMAGRSLRVSIDPQDLYYKLGGQVEAWVRRLDRTLDYPALA